jgi:hypothetical protein
MNAKGRFLLPKKGSLELTLGGEVIVDDRRGDTRAPGDLAHRCALVAPLGKHPHAGVEYRPPALGAGEPASRFLSP